MIVKIAKEREVLIRMNLNLESETECVSDLLGPTHTWKKWLSKGKVRPG